MSKQTSKIVLISLFPYKNTPKKVQILPYIIFKRPLGTSCVKNKHVSTFSLFDMFLWTKYVNKCVTKTKVHIVPCCNETKKKFEKSDICSKSGVMSFVDFVVNVRYLFQVLYKSKRHIYVTI